MKKVITLLVVFGLASGLMAAQVKNLTDADIEAIANRIGK